MKIRNECGEWEQNNHNEHGNEHDSKIQIEIKIPKTLKNRKFIFINYKEIRG